MAASPKQKMQARLLLGLPLADVETAMDALDVEELEELGVILAAAEKAKLRSATVDSDGVKYDPEEDRRVQRDRLSILLSLASPYDGFVGTVTPDPCVTHLLSRWDDSVVWP